jgi:hypothetical protein
MGDWREEIWRRWGIATVDPEAVPRDRQTLWTTRCCRIKSEMGGTPKDLYRSELPQRFLHRMARLGLRHAIVSDLYGLHFPDVRMAAYDTAPGDLDPAERRMLGEQIGEQARGRALACLCFYNNSPLMSRPYFEILSHSGLPVMYHTRLPVAR